MGTSTCVEMDALIAFGHELLDRLATFTTATASAQLPIAGTDLGASGMAESLAAGANHCASAQATAQFLQDAADGLLALSYVAATVAQHYGDGDAEQAGSMRSVADAFAPAPTTESISSRRDAALARQREEQRFRNRVPEFVAPVDPELLRFQNQVGAATGRTGNRYSAAADAVAEHNRVVGGDAYTPDSAENDYRLDQDHQDAVDDAAERADHDNIPYAVQVDDHGVSTVVQADPDGVPHPDPVRPYTQLDPGHVTYSVD